MKKTKNMALDRLSEKLDHISNTDLDFKFDEAAVWTKLEQRLDNRKVGLYWWLVAACLLIGLIFFPISLMKDNTEVSPAISATEPAIIEEGHALHQQSEEEVIPAVKIHDIKSLARKEIATAQIVEIPMKKLSLVPIVQENPKKIKNTAFAVEDISIIQASLEQPTVEKGRTITIRAQWQKSPDELNVNYQALKIKLYEKDKNQ